MMKKRSIKGLIALSLAAGLLFSVPAMADSRSVVTLGVDLSDTDRDAILRYFGADLSKVDVVYVNNQQERDYLGSYIPLEQIGSRTYSCAYVQPTNAGGVQVKTANLTYVTGNMIATALSTSGVSNCNVIAASPFPVSGTGALTGVIIAYESASGQELVQEQKDLAVEEFVVTQQAADSIGADAALQIVNGIKMEIISNGVEPEDEEQIEMIVNEVIDNVQTITVIDNSVENVDNSVDNSDNSVDNSITVINNGLSDEDRALLVSLAQEIAAQKYDYEEVRDTLERVEDNLSQVTNVHAVDEGVEYPPQPDGTEEGDGVDVVEPAEPAQEPVGESIMDNTDDSVFDAELQSSTMTVTSEEPSDVVEDEPVSEQPEAPAIDPLEQEHDPEQQIPSSDEGEPVEESGTEAPADATDETGTEAETETETETETEEKEQFTSYLVDAEHTGVFLRIMVDATGVMPADAEIVLTPEEGEPIRLVATSDNMMTANNELSGLSGTTFLFGIASAPDGKYMCDGTVTLLDGSEYTIHEPVTVENNDCFSDDFVLSDMVSGSAVDLKVAAPAGTASFDAVFNNTAVAHIENSEDAQIAIDGVPEIVRVVFDAEGYTVLTLKYMNEAGDEIKSVEIPFQVAQGEVPEEPVVVAEPETAEDMYVGTEDEAYIPEDLSLGFEETVEEPQVLPDLTVED